MKKEYSIPILKALEFFIENPNEEIYLREFARKVDVSLNSAQRFLKFFLDEGFVKDYRKANLRYFRANLNSVVFRNIKITYSLKKISDSGLIDFLGSEFSHVVLYGSVARGLDDKKSDLDIVCVGKGKKPDVYGFSRKFGREISLQIFSFEKWEKTKKENKAFYQDVISTGINLIGEMPV